MKYLASVFLPTTECLRRYISGTLVVFFVGLLHSVAWAEKEPMGLAEIYNIYSNGTDEQVRDMIQRDPPKDAWATTLNLYFTGQSAGAIRIDEIGQLEVIMRRWVDKVPGNMQVKINLLRLLTIGGGGSLDEVLEMTAAAMKSTDLANERVVLQSILASTYARAGDIDASLAALDVAQKMVDTDLERYGTSGARAYWKANALYEFYFSQCVILTQLQRFAQAERACQLQLASAEKSANFPMSEGARRTVAGNVARAHLTLAHLAVAKGALFEAEQYVFSSIRVTRQQGGANYGIADASATLMAIRSAQRRYAEAQQIADLDLNRIVVRRMSPISVHAMRIRRLLQNNLVAQSKWVLSAQAFDELDALTKDAEVKTRLAALNLLARGATLISVGRAAQILAALEAELPKAEKTLGAGNPHTALLRGLRAMARMDAGVASYSEVLEELAQSVADMTSPSAISGGYLKLGERPNVQRLISQRYLELAMAGSDSRHAALAFQVADFLRGSAVQQAINDSAVRSAASTKGLADLVRADQDANNELQGLYNFIARQQDEMDSKSLDAVVAKMKERINALETQRAGSQAEIAKQFPQYDQLVHPQPPLPIDIAARLGPGEVFVALMPSDRHVFVWAIAQQGSRFARVELSNQSLGELIQKIRKTLDVAGLGTGVPAFDTRAASQLYRQLLGPVEQLIISAKHLIIAPAGILGQIPFGVLLTQDSADPTSALPWLVRKTAVSHVASASAWMALKQSATFNSGTEPFIGWGDPQFDLKTIPKSERVAARTIELTRNGGADLSNDGPRTVLNYASISPLPETRDELLAIANVLNADPKADNFFGDKATRESVIQASQSGQLQRKRVIAFATHGLMPGDLPNVNQPALAMAATGKELTDAEGALLTLKDVLGLKLNADWVILSACNTAAADGQAEEALSGLARGFFYAGARSLLVTHWAVESESAKQLTTATFEHYVRNPQALKAESLRQAMLKVMSDAKYAHPAYWAPYALVGDGGR